MCDSITHHRILIIRPILTIHPGVIEWARGIFWVDMQWFFALSRIGSHSLEPPELQISTRIATQSQLWRDMNLSFLLGWKIGGCARHGDGTIVWPVVVPPNNKTWVERNHLSMSAKEKTVLKDQTYLQYRSQKLWRSWVPSIYIYTHYVYIYIYRSWLTLNWYLWWMKQLRRERGVLPREIKPNVSMCRSLSRPQRNE